MNKFTGWVDVPFSKLGRLEPTKASYKLREYRVEVCFTSVLIRAIETAIICLTEYEEICAGKTSILKHEVDQPHLP